MLELVCLLGKEHHVCDTLTIKLLEIGDGKVTLGLSGPVEGLSRQLDDFEERIRAWCREVCELPRQKDVIAAIRAKAGLPRE